MVAAGLDHDAVVARVEEAVGDADVAGGVDVDAVTVGALALGGGLALGIGGDEADAAHDDIVAVDGVEHPHGGLEEGDVGDEDVFAMIETDEGRAEELGGLGEVGGGEFFAGFDAVVKGAPRGLVGGGVLAGGGFAAAGVGAPPPVPALAVEGAAAGDGDVVFALGVDEGGVGEDVGAFPARGDEGGIGGVAAVEEFGPGLEVERLVALGHDGAGEVFAGGEKNGAAAGVGAGGDGCGDGGGVFGFAVGHGAVIEDVKNGGAGRRQQGRGEGEEQQSQGQAATGVHNDQRGGEAGRRSGEQGAVGLAREGARGRTRMRSVGRTRVRVKGGVRRGPAQGAFRIPARAIRGGPASPRAVDRRSWRDALSRARSGRPTPEKPRAERTAHPGETARGKKPSCVAGTGAAGSLTGESGRGHAGGQFRFSPCRKR